MHTAYIHLNSVRKLFRNTRSGVAQSTIYSAMLTGQLSTAHHLAYPELGKVSECRRGLPAIGVSNEYCHRQCGCA
jgi:hypothetical protein